MNDFLKITGWPLLGVVSVSRSHKFWQRVPQLLSSLRARVHSALHAHGPAAAEAAQGDLGDAGGPPVDQREESPDPRSGTVPENAAPKAGTARSGSTADPSPGDSPGGPGKAAPGDTSPLGEAPLGGFGGPASRGFRRGPVPFDPITGPVSRGPLTGASGTGQPEAPSQDDDPNSSPSTGTELS